jgi:hypothetical protein
MEMRCPKCDSDELGTAGKADSSRNQRWRCKACGHRTTNPCGLGTEPMFKTELPEATRYVITAAQNATGIHTAFFRALKKYCDVNKAELIIVPFRYRNPTSIWSAADESQDWWQDDLNEYMYDGRMYINTNLQLLSDIKVTPTAVTPLSGFETITGGDSGIIAHPKIEMKCIATPANKLPKMMMTTGACTLMNYTDTKAGKKGEFHHSFGALVIEVDGNHFHSRQINAMKDGSFMDIAGGKVRRYTGNKVKRVAGIEALVMGDTHVDFLCPDVVEATFGKGGIIDVLKPKKLVWHDLLDFFSRSHHCDAIGNIAKAKTGRDNVREEVERAVDFIVSNTPKNVVSVLVPSNHNEHLGKWINEEDWKMEGINAEFYLETALAMVKGATVDPLYGISHPDPFHYWVTKLKPKHTLRLLTRDTSDVAKAIELSMHGDKGLNGARGSLLGLSKIGVKSIIGHSHTPGIRDGCYQVGTSSVLRRDWNSGPSSWMNTHCLVYPNGKRSLINIIGTTWRADDLPNLGAAAA